MQRSLNLIDFDERSQNLIISGMPENEMTLDDENVLRNDKDKIKQLFKNIKIPNETIKEIDTYEISRLGQAKTNYNRIIKVNMKSKDKRDTIVNSANLLRDLPVPWNKIYAKKDMHPVYLRENSRLGTKMANLKRDNSDNNKVILIEKGRLTVDGVTVDKNTFFV